MRMSRLPSLLLAAAFALAGCRHGGSASDTLSPEQEERAATVLEWTSQGAVSRDGHVEIHFRTPWAADDEIGKDADGQWLEISPDLEGRLWWRDGKTLVFDAEEDLEPGKLYHARLDLPRLTGDTSLPVYPFSFVAAARTAELSPASWSARGDEASAAVSVSFSDPPSDTAKASRVEADQQGRDLKTSWTWTGPASARVQIDGIRLGMGPATLRLEAGEGGLDEDASVGLSVPSAADGLFPVWIAPFAENGREGFRVLLADPPANASDLQGVLDVPGVEDARHELDGSMARISWPERGKAAQILVRVGKGEPVSFNWEFRGRKPGVRWAEEGAIVTSKAKNQLHFEAVNLERVRVRVVRVTPANVPEFLDDNRLDEGISAGRRPGRLVWDRVISLQARPDVPLQGAIDLEAILAAQGAGLYSVELRRERAGMLYRCGDTTRKAVSEEGDGTGEDGEDEEEGYSEYEHREDPCSDAYWREWWMPVARRNVVVSDIGLMAWREPSGRIVAVASDLLDAEPWKGVELEALGGDDRVLSSATTSSEGFAELSGGREARVLHARAKRDGRDMHAWLRLRDGEARNLSRFDVAGVGEPDGIRLFPWAERGVYRPGDSIFVGCLVRGPDGREMDRLPLRMTLRDPSGRVAATTTLRAAPEGMFSWRLATAPEDATGRWSLQAEAGPASAELPVLVETIRPNRLKIEIAAPAVIGEGGEEGRVSLASHWLSGGSAAGLRAQVQAQLSPAPFSPKGMSEFVFTDPTREGAGGEATESVVWEGSLDGEGKADFSLSAPAASEAAGPVQASLRTRVFESGGRASVDRFSVLLSPCSSYAGVHLRTRSSWGWIEAGTPMGIEVVSASPRGVRVAGARMKIEVWRHPETWWWEEGDGMRGFLSREGVEKAWEGEAASGGSASFTPREEGRYVVLVRDPSGHVAGTSVGVWSGWGGSRQGPGASPSLLSLQADHDTVAPGGRVGVAFPSSKGGRALVQLLDGRRILSQEWIATDSGRTAWKGEVPTGAGGGLYVQVTLLQSWPPSTDRPLRMWGVVPVSVVDPATKLVPEIVAPAEIRPLAKTRVRIRERSGRPMRAMLAFVDEGLLDLTRFSTPDPWEAFHGRAALRVQGWDMFDLVVGSWSGRTDRLFAVGGSEDARRKAAQAKGNPFPPLVIVKGPFDVKGSGTDVELDIPRYTGSARLMVVAASGRAFGSAEKAVPVRAPVMALLTVPRALSPSDRVTIPVTVFAGRAGRVQVRLKLAGPIAAEGPTVAWADFRAPGDQVVDFAIRATEGTGTASVSVDASSPAGSGSDAQAFEVRHPGAPVSRGSVMAATDSLGWILPLQPWGVAGTRTTRLEISTSGLIGMEDRIDDLIEYPHGCLEQTLSGLVPQIFLRALVPWSPEPKLKKADANVRAGLERLRRFQTASGAFSLWPGEGEAYPWGTLWALRGMLAAREAGFEVPAGVFDPALAWVAEKANGFRPGSEARRGDTLQQVSRLDILAMAGKPDLAAMNRLREAPLGDLERWTLAAAYASAGRADVARSLSARAGTEVTNERMMLHNLNSPVRDRALMAEAMARAQARSKSAELIRGVRHDMRDASRWYSTQELGTALWALARLQKAPPKNVFNARWRVDQGPWHALRVSGNASTAIPSDVAGTLEVRIDGQIGAEAYLSSRAVPDAGEPIPPPNGLELDVAYEGADGQRIDPSSIAQGEDFRVIATVRNVSGRGLPNIALTQVFPGGWEIRNDAIEGGETEAPAPEHPRWNEPVAPRRTELRDDRAVHYLELPAGSVARMVVGIRAAYAGSYVRPGAHVEALYDASWQATLPTGRCVIAPR